METILLYNPNTFDQFEATVIELGTLSYRQIKDIITEQTVYNGIYKNMDALLQELIALCTSNDWFCQPIGISGGDMKFEAFYDAQDN